MVAKSLHPYSFVEGGTGTAGQGIHPEGDGAKGTTICAPMGMTNGCAGQQLPRADKVWSEQSEYSYSPHENVLQEKRISRCTG